MNCFKTRITELFGIEYPIIQGGMMWLARAELAAAVAEAGGIGFMTALTHSNAEGLRAEIKKVRTLTRKPFGVNLTLLPSLRPPDYPSYVKVCIEEEVKFIETAGRNPEEFIAPLKEAGIKIIHKCTSVKHAIKAEKIGCDAISIDGFECAGHPGEDDVTSLILIPRTRDSVNIPIISSGGFGDGRGLVAALALGADGMNMGTRFLATKECPAHENVKKAIIAAKETDTRVIMRSFKNSGRVLNTPNALKVLEIEAKGNASIEDIRPYVSGIEGAKMYLQGEMDKGVLSVGQVVGLIDDIPTVAELMQRIIAQAREITKTLVK